MTEQLAWAYEASKQRFAVRNGCALALFFYLCICSKNINVCIRTTRISTNACV